MADGDSRRAVGLGRGPDRAHRAARRRRSDPPVAIRTGDAVTFRLHYRMHEPLDQPVFGISICSGSTASRSPGPNTREAGLVAGSRRRSAASSTSVDRLLLVPGTYDLSASLVNYTLAHVYDFSLRGAPLRRRAGNALRASTASSRSTRTWRGAVLRTVSPAASRRFWSPPATCSRPRWRGRRSAPGRSRSRCRGSTTSSS